MSSSNVQHYKKRLYISFLFSFSILFVSSVWEFLIYFSFDPFLLILLFITFLVLFCTISQYFTSNNSFKEDIIHVSSFTSSLFCTLLYSTLLYFNPHTYFSLLFFFFIFILLFFHPLMSFNVFVFIILCFSMDFFLSLVLNMSFNFRQPHQFSVSFIVSLKFFVGFLRKFQ